MKQLFRWPGSSFLVALACALVLAPPSADAQAPGAKPAAPLGPQSFREVLRGDDAKAWLTREPTPKKKYVIAVALPNMPDPSWQAIWYGAQAQGQKLGVTMRIADAGGYNKLDVQVSQLENFIQLKVDGIVIGAVQGDGVAPILRRAADSGIKIVDAFLYESSGRTASRVINDQREIGAAEAAYLGRTLGGKGNVVMLFGPAGNATLTERGLGFKAALGKDYPQMKILAERFSDINRPEGLKQMEDLLQAFPGQINGVYSPSAFLADGAADAILAKRAGKILIATAGTNVGVIERLRKSEIHMVADQQNVMQGRMAVNVIVAALNGDPVPELIAPPIREITAENVGSIDWSVSLPPTGWKP
jgi:ABC-type sugar transport system substrate-binding protein